VKTCSRCEDTKPCDEFGKSAGGKNGLRSYCKACARAYSKAYNDSHREERNSYAREYHATHKVERADYQRAYEASRPEVTAAKKRAWHQANAEKGAVSSRKYVKNHPEKVAARAKAYQEAHKAEISARQRRYRQENAGRVRARNQAYREANLKEVTEYRRGYHKANPEASVTAAHKRRVHKVGNKSFVVTTKEMKRIWNSACVYCGATENINADHVVPIAKGGSHGIGNLQPLCKSCNSSKGASLYVVFKYRKAGLL